MTTPPPLYSGSHRRRFRLRRPTSNFSLLGLEDLQNHHLRLKQTFYAPTQILPRSTTNTNLEATLSSPRKFPSRPHDLHYPPSIAPAGRCPPLRASACLATRQRRRPAALRRTTNFFGDDAGELDLHLRRYAPLGTADFPFCVIRKEGMRRRCYPPPLALPMSSASCLAPPPPRLPCARVRLPPPSSAAATERPSLGFGPRTAAPTKGWRLVHMSCFRQEQDGPTTSDDGTGFKYIKLVEISGDTEVKEEYGGSPRGGEQSYEEGDWFVRVQKMKENLQERIFRFQNERWKVPWTGKTIAQVMILWIATFWLVGSWIVPFLAHAAGFSKETLTHRGQALYSLLTDITEGLAGIAILHRCLGRFRPLPPGWFEFKLKGRWHWDVALGCLLFPLVNLLSHINISLVPLSSGPVAGVSSVEQSIVARDPVAMALYAVVVTLCAPIWEEIVFRGFLLPSLTRYMPLPWSILVSATAFALAHFNAQRVMPLIFLGVVMGGVFARSRNLLASMVLHSLWNGFVFLDLMK